MVKALALLIYLSLISVNAWSADPPLTLYDEGSKQGVIFKVDCVGSGVACTKSGTTGTVTVSGGSGSGTVGIGTTGWMPYYGSNGSTLNATSNIRISGSNVGIGTATAPQLLYVAGTTETQSFKMTSAGSAGDVLTRDSVGLGTWKPISSGGGTPGGANQQVQYNNSSAFGGSSAFVFNGTNVGIGTSTASNTIDIETNSVTGGMDINTIGSTEGIDSSSVLVLHGDGTDASTTFTDSSSAPHTMTANGNAQVDTADSKFGGASILLDGNGDYITSIDSADWNFGSGDFTIDFWYKPTANGADMFYCQEQGSGLVYLYRETNNTLNFYVVSTGGSVLAEYNFSWTPTLNTWTHVAVQRTGTSFGIAIDGIWKSLTTATAIGSTSLPDLTGNLVISGTSRNINYDVSGWLDEYRVTKGLSRWTIGSNFTPPTSAYNSGNARSSINFQTANGTTRYSVGAVGTTSSALFQIGTTAPDTNPRITITSTGNVGIGTSSPAGGLIIHNGNVGIGTLTPGSPLTIRGGTLMQKVSAANTACATTCGLMGCYFGEDTGVIGTLLDCADATADVCLCSK